MFFVRSGNKRSKVGEINKGDDELNEDDNDDKDGVLE